MTLNFGLVLSSDLVVDLESSFNKTGLAQEIFYNLDKGEPSDQNN